MKHGQFPEGNGGNRRIVNLPGALAEAVEDLDGDAALLGAEASAS